MPDYRLDDFESLTENARQLLGEAPGRAVDSLDFSSLRRCDLVRVTDALGWRFLIEIISPTEKTAFVVRLAPNKSYFLNLEECRLSRFIFRDESFYFLMPRGTYILVPNIAAIEILEERIKHPAVAKRPVFLFLKLKK